MGRSMSKAALIEMIVEKHPAETHGKTSRAWAKQVRRFASEDL